MDRWKGIPESQEYMNVVRESLHRTLEMAVRDFEDASVMMATALYVTILETDPDGLKMARELGGEEGEMRALEFLAGKGFPEELPRIPRNQSERRKTPEEVRALWPICSAAVDKVFLGLPNSTRKDLTLNMSWALHRMALQRFPSYGLRMEAKRLEKEAKRKKQA